MFNYKTTVARIPQIEAEILDASLRALAVMAHPEWLATDLDPEHLAEVRKYVEERVRYFGLVLHVPLFIPRQSVHPFWLSKEGQVVVGARWNVWECDLLYPLQMVQRFKPTDSNSKALNFIFRRLKAFDVPFLMQPERLYDPTTASRRKRTGSGRYYVWAVPREYAERALTP